MTTKEGAGSIVLIGFMGTGKSSVGRLLAEETGANFVDTDQLVAARMKQSIAEIFATLGEGKFREEETRVLRELDAAQRMILATGGGIILRDENHELLRRLGPIVCLQANEETIWSRVSRRSHRPLLQTANPRETMMALLRTREPLYRAAADVVVETSDLPHADAAAAVLREVETLLRCRTAH